MHPPLPEPSRQVESASVLQSPDYMYMYYDRLLNCLKLMSIAMNGWKRGPFGLYGQFSPEHLVVWARVRGGPLEERETGALEVAAGKQRAPTQPCSLLKAGSERRLSNALSSS